MAFAVNGKVEDFVVLKVRKAKTFKETATFCSYLLLIVEFSACNIRENVTLKNCVSEISIPRW